MLVSYASGRAIRKLCHSSDLFELVDSIVIRAALYSMGLTSSCKMIKADPVTMKVINCALVSKLATVHRHIHELRLCLRSVSQHLQEV